MPELTGSEPDLVEPVRHETLDDDLVERQIARAAAKIQALHESEMRERGIWSEATVREQLRDEVGEIFRLIEVHRAERFENCAVIVVKTDMPPHAVRQLAAQLKGPHIPASTPLLVLPPGGDLDALSDRDLLLAGLTRAGATTIPTECPGCKSDQVKLDGTDLLCSACGQSWPLVDEWAGVDHG